MAVGTACATTVGAQGIDSQCKSVSTVERATQDLCQKTLDLFAFLTPQLGGALSGGNAVPGEHSGLRGSGHASFGLRVSGVRAGIPRLDMVRPVLTGAVRSAYQVSTAVVLVPTLDAALGLTRGFPVSGTNVLGVDALASASWFPEAADGGVTATPSGGQLKLGFGARVSILEETILTPGIGVTVLRRDLPRMGVRARTAGDELTLDDFEIKTTAWRVVAGKHFAFLGLSAGAGQDTYKSSATSNLRASQGGSVFTLGPILAFEEVTRDNVFASVSVSFLLVRLVAEASRTSGGLVATYNGFGSAGADRPLQSITLGARFRW